MEVSDIKRFGEHRNAFGFLRLLFASLVIVSHVPSLIDGDLRREPLMMLFGTVPLGKLAVDGFFIISGYLILGSYLKLPRAWPYLKKRIARIYPAFLLATLLCVAVAAPLGGAAGSLADPGVWLRSAGRAFALMSPGVPGAFAGTPYPELNGSTWTIAYEFRCYLLVLALGMAGGFSRPFLIPAAAVICLILFKLPEFGWERHLGSTFEHVFGDPRRTLRLTGDFLMGCTFYLYQDRVKYSGKWLAAAAIALIGCMFIPLLAEPALATLGAYLIFGFARWGSTGWLQSVNNKNDVSYGVYLYAWPVTKILTWFWPTMPLVVVGLLTFAIAYALGWLSWHLLEKPVMERLR